MSRRSGEEAPSGFFLLADPLGDEQRLPAVGHALGGDGDLTHVLPAGQVEHDVGHHLLERSEEHTSELQSRFDLVCRLLLEKKKKKKKKKQRKIIYYHENNK